MLATLAYASQAVYAIACMLPYVAAAIRRRYAIIAGMPVDKYLRHLSRFSRRYDGSTNSRE